MLYQTSYQCCGIAVVYQQCALTAQALGSWLSAYTHMGVKAYKTEHGSRRPVPDEPQVNVHEAVGHTAHHSNALFSWLFKACLAYQLYEWLRVRRLSLLS